MIIQIAHFAIVWKQSKMIWFCDNRHFPQTPAEMYSDLFQSGLIIVKYMNLSQTNSPQLEIPLLSQQIQLQRKLLLNLGCFNKRYSFIMSILPQLPKSLQCMFPVDACIRPGCSCSERSGAPLPSSRGHLTKTSWTFLERQAWGWS